MENLTVPGAVSALSKAFSDMLSAGCESFAEFEPRALELARRSAAEAMSLALEAMDAELLASRPAGTTVHSHRPRTLATMTGDVRFSHGAARPLRLHDLPARRGARTVEQHNLSTAQRQIIQYDVANCV